MQFTSEVLIKIAIFILGLCGFLVAKHIYNHKTKNTPLICPARFDCHAVVHSDYSRFLGIRVEILGMCYYAFTVVAYAVFIFKSELLFFGHADLINIFFFSLSLAAFLFSTYLIAVQIFILKKGCSWCIVSAFICLCIFILTVIK
ncbi:MAG: vitamin K epoxide reductase family protein [Patescibacteria group bacterium]|nr:vitamin K epoxide reductase family protein [Patescibacteria group bacterium]